MTFSLHPNLANKIEVFQLPLCTVLLEDECHYPWLLLVPRRANAARMMDLLVADQHQLMVELNVAQKIVWEVFFPDQINVAAIGNKTPQLHVHVIARFHSDPAWPGTVWDHPTRAAYASEEKQRLVRQLAVAFS